MKKKMLFTPLLTVGVVAASLLMGSVSTVSGDTLEYEEHGTQLILTAEEDIPDFKEFGKKLMATIEMYLTEERNSEYTMAVLVPSANPFGENKNILTKAQVKELLDEKYLMSEGKSIVSKIFKPDGKTEVEKDNEKVGTDYKVNLITGDTMTVVLYGDVTGDGVIDTSDTVAIAQNNVGNPKLTGNKAKAAKLTFKEQNENDIDTADTVRLALYNVNGLGNDEQDTSFLDLKLWTFTSWMSRGTEFLDQRKRLMNPPMEGEPAVYWSEWSKADKQLRITGYDPDRSAIVGLAEIIATLFTYTDEGYWDDAHFRHMNFPEPLTVSFEKDGKFYTCPIPEPPEAGFYDYQCDFPASTFDEAITEAGLTSMNDLTDITFEISYYNVDILHVDHFDEFTHWNPEDLIPLVAPVRKQVFNLQIAPNPLDMKTCWDEWMKEGMPA